MKLKKTTLTVGERVEVKYGFGTSAEWQITEY